MARKTTLDELGEMLAHVVHSMATKDDIMRLDTKIDRLEISITVITHPSPSADQAEAAPVGAARTALMASSGLRPDRKSVV